MTCCCALQIVEAIRTAREQEADTTKHVASHAATTAGACPPPSSSDDSDPSATTFPPQPGVSSPMSPPMSSLWPNETMIPNERHHAMAPVDTADGVDSSRTALIQAGTTSTVARHNPVGSKAAASSPAAQPVARIAADEAADPALAEAAAGQGFGGDVTAHGLDAASAASALSTSVHAAPMCAEGADACIDQVDFGSLGTRKRRVKVQGASNGRAAEGGSAATTTLGIVAALATPLSPRALVADPTDAIPRLQAGGECGDRPAAVEGCAPGSSADLERQVPRAADAAHQVAEVSAIAASFTCPFVGMRDAEQPARAASEGAEDVDAKEMVGERDHELARGQVRAAADMLLLSSGPGQEIARKEDIADRGEPAIGQPLSTRQRYSRPPTVLAKRGRVEDSDNDDGGGKLGDVTTILLHKSGQGRGRGRGRGQALPARRALRSAPATEVASARNPEFVPFDYDSVRAVREGASRGRLGRGGPGRAGRWDRGRGRGRVGVKRTGILDGRAESGYNPFAVEKSDFKEVTRSGSTRSGNKSGTL
jgi:hypothetical protein